MVYSINEHSKNHKIPWIDHNGHKQEGELKKLLEGTKQPHKELTTNALRTYQSDYHTGNITHTKQKLKASLFHFYLPKSEYFIISDKQKPVNTSIRVKLPRERDRSKYLDR